MKKLHSFKNMKKLICITGMDGIGKSTLINMLASQINSCYIANIWDLLDSQVKGLPFRTKKDLDNYICDLTPDSRFLFLAHALKYSTDVALSTNKKIILLDSYYFKYMATELALGAEITLVMEVVQRFPKPHLVVELKLPMDEIIKRKTKFSRYECGLAEVADKLSFIKFQEKVKEKWQEISIKNFHTLNAIESKEMLVGKILNLIAIT